MNVTHCYRFYLSSTLKKEILNDSDDKITHKKMSHQMQQSEGNPQLLAFSTNPPHVLPLILQSQPNLILGPYQDQFYTINFRWGQFSYKRKTVVL